MHCSYCSRALSHGYQFYPSYPAVSQSWWQTAGVGGRFSWLHVDHLGLETREDRAEIQSFLAGCLPSHILYRTHRAADLVRDGSHQVSDTIRLGAVCMQRITASCTGNRITHWGRVTRILQWSGSILDQVMACHLFGIKPLPKLKLNYCQLDF